MFRTDPIPWKWAWHRLSQVLFWAHPRWIICWWQKVHLQSSNWVVWEGVGLQLSVKLVLVQGNLSCCRCSALRRGISRLCLQMGSRGAARCVEPIESCSGSYRSDQSYSCTIRSVEWSCWNDASAKSQLSSNLQVLSWAVSMDQKRYQEYFWRITDWSRHYSQGPQICSDWRYTSSD